MPQSSEVAITSATVGMTVGVFAAAFSHFVLSIWNNSVLTVPLAAAVGTIFGLILSPLFYNFSAELRFSPSSHLMMSSGLTFAVTATVGIFLARRERANQK
jgi:hypothetical protein